MNFVSSGVLKQTESGKLIEEESKAKKLVRLSKGNGQQEDSELSAIERDKRILDNRIAMLAQNEKQLELEEIEKKKALQLSMLPKGLDEEDIDNNIIVVHADKEIKYNDVIEVASIAAELKAKVSLATQSGK